MTCPLEGQIAALLDRAGLPYIRPETNKDDPTTLDFFVPSLGLYIEVKQWHSDRIAAQLARVPAAADALVLVGRHSVERLLALFRALSEAEEIGR